MVVAPPAPVTTMLVTGISATEELEDELEDDSLDEDELDVDVELEDDELVVEELILDEIPKQLPSINATPAMMPRLENRVFVNPIDCFIGIPPFIK
jgi:hypothetical protein